MYLKSLLNSSMSFSNDTYKVVPLLVALSVVMSAPLLTYAIASCPKTSRTLSEGARGADVSSVQQFLATQGISSDTPYGTYGPKTKDAVRFFQNSVSIPDTGAVDSVTYKAMLDACAEEEQASFKDDLSVAPTAGKAPLTIKATAIVTETADTDFLLDFGDGTKPTVLPCAGADACSRGIDYKYVFKKSGNYPVSLFRSYSSHGASVEGGSGNSKSLVRQVLVRVDDAKQIEPPRLCKEWFNGCTTCVRESAEDDFICSKKICLGAFKPKECVSEFAINQPPEVVVSGPNNVERNVMRTWVAEGFDPEGTRMTYAFDWGDSKKDVSDLIFNIKPFVTYAYKTKGVYTLTVYAKDADDAVGSTSMIVRVRDSLKDVACGREYQPVCARKKICAADGTGCKYLLKNYVNSCLMLKDEGILITPGICR